MADTALKSVGPCGNLQSSKSTKLMDGEEMSTTGQSKRPITEEEQEEQ
jgi:hypothetical protein